MTNDQSTPQPAFLTPSSFTVSSFTTPTRNHAPSTLKPFPVCPTVLAPKACASHSPRPKPAPPQSSVPPVSSVFTSTPSEAAPQHRPVSALPSTTSIYGIDASALLSDAAERLRAFIKVRASLDPDCETVYDFSGVVHAMVPGMPARALFKVEGFSVAVAGRTDLGWRLLTREVAVYRDMETNEALTHWTNPWTGEVRDVIQVWNDPVNQELTTDPVRTPLVSHMVSQDLVCWSVDVFPRYKSPLPMTAFPHVGGPDLYESGELFSFFAEVDDVSSPSASHVKGEVAMAWSRIGPWLPWMGMGDEAGQLVYHCRGTRVRDGITGLRDSLKDFVLQQGAEKEKFFHAPTEFSRPNETSWSYMRKLVEAKGSPRADGRVASPSPSKRKEEAKSSVEEPDNNGEGKKLLNLTSSQLRAFEATKEESGQEGRRHIYLAVAGRIFDVSKAPEHYGFGETYHKLTGKDASYALLTGDFKDQGREQRRTDGGNEVDLTRLTDDQKWTLTKWLHFFEERYEQVGTLADYEGERLVN